MGNVINIERKRMRFVNNYFRTMRTAVREDERVISELASVHTFWDGSGDEIARAYNAALATGRKVVVYKKLGGMYASIPAVGEGLGDDLGGKENNWL